MGYKGKDLNLLIALRALLEEGNVSKAGERIGIGQSSMSAALSRLRQQFGDELLVRVGRDYELTPMARLILPKLQSTIPAIEAGLMTQDEFDPKVSSRRFRILMSDYAALQLQSRIDQALSEAPDVRIDVLPLPQDPSENTRQLTNHDFLITVPGIGIQGDHQYLFSDRYVCMIDRENPALVDGALTWERFISLPQAVCSLGQGHVLPHDRLLAEMGFSRVAKVKTTGFLSLESVVAHSDLVAIVPSKLFQFISSSSRVIAVPTPFDEVPLIEHLWWHHTKKEDQGHRWLREILCNGWDE